MKNRDTWQAIRRLSAFVLSALLAIGFLALFTARIGVSAAPGGGMPDLAGVAAVDFLESRSDLDALQSAFSAAADGDDDERAAAVSALTAPDGTNNNLFGWSVAVSGDTAVVGAPRDLPPINPGSVYVFVRSGSGWVQQQKLLSPFPNSTGQFGVSVSISGDTLIVGSQGLPPFGLAFVYVRSGTTWTLQQQFSPPSGNQGEPRFGTSVSVSGGRALIGAQSESTSGLRSGAAYIYERTGSNWALQQRLTAPDAVASTQFGNAVALDGDQAIIAAFCDGSAGPTSGCRPGAAHVFVKSGTSWVHQQKLTASDGANNDQFGWTVALLGNTAVIGAHFDDVGANADQGSAYVFTRSGTTWTQDRKLTAPDGAANDSFGSGVALDGTLFAIGARSDDVGANANQGSVYAYNRCAPPTNAPVKLTAVSPAAQDLLGYSVYVADDTIIAGAPANGRLGSAHVFPKSDIALRPDGAAQCESEIIVNVVSDEADLNLDDDVCDADAQSGRQCTLRAAIQTANDLPGPDTIKFNIPGGGLRTIAPATALPPVSGKVTIDATTQPGYSDRPLIELSGVGSTGPYGIMLAPGSGSSEVRGLMINRFVSAALKLESDANIVSDCFIGVLGDGNSVDSAGRQAAGIEITGARNRIGSGRVADRRSNLISGSLFDQVLMHTAAAVDNVVSGNDIGILANGDPAGVTTFNGVTIEDSASGNRVGGPLLADLNLIGGVASYGVLISEGANDNTVITNTITESGVGIGIVKASDNIIGGQIDTSNSNLTRNAIGGNEVGIFVGDNPNVDDPRRDVSELAARRLQTVWKRRANSARPGGAVETMNNRIEGNVIGMTRAFVDFGNDYGINVRAAGNTQIGTGASGFHNFIGGNVFEGVLIEKDAFQTRLRGNFIGVDITGTTIKANRSGVVVAGSGNEIATNVISGNNDYGLVIRRDLKTDPAPSGNLIDNNRIGLKADGSIAIPNDESGLRLDGENNTVTRNVVSGNGHYGIEISGNGNTVTNNRVGTNTAGTEARANAEGGMIVSSSGNIIEDNVISGNNNVGLLITRDSQQSPVPPSGNVVKGNRIGTDNAGTAALGNSQVGIALADGANNNIIGGNTAGDGNVISGNGVGGGINIQIGVAAGAVPPSSNRIQGNRIGTDISGTIALANAGNGITIMGALGTLIGGIAGDMPNARNIISGNTTNGISLSMAAAGTRISGNYIGTAIDGQTALGNGERGIRVGVSVVNTMIGGPELNAGNTIAFNGSNGISLTNDAGNNNIIDPNRIFGNAMAGIDIGEDGFTPNDPADADVGPNKRQNYPTFTASIIGGDLIVRFQVDSAPQHSSYGTNGIYVEFFEADPTGAGRDFLGFDHFRLSDYMGAAPGFREKNLGNAATLGIAVGDRLTATATDADGNSSEFTPVVSAASAPVTIGGRVTTPSGAALRSAVVILTAPDGTRRTATTSSFGVYAFANVPSGVNYTITVSSKRYRFAPRVELITHNANNFDMVGLE